MPMIIMFETTGHSAPTKIFGDLRVRIAAMRVASPPNTISGRPKPP